jgi:transcriptional regulator GlxA family with amidase domain
LLDVAEAAEAFRIAERLSPNSYSMQFVAFTRKLHSGVGLQVANLRALPKCVPDHSMIVTTGVVGRALDLKAAATQRASKWLAQMMRNPTVSLMCVCAGSVLAAHAGLLKGVQCTTHYAHIEELMQIEKDAVVHPNRIFVEDGRISTSAGVTAGLDLALHVIGKQLGHRIAASVARELVVYARRSGTDPALSPWIMHRNHLHSAVHRVQDAVSANPTADWSASSLACVGCTSPRNLARLFAEHAGCSPLDYVQRIRVALARELVKNSSLDLERVAEKSGFASAHQLRRVWRRWESEPPAAQRSPATS